MRVTGIKDNVVLSPKKGLCVVAKPTKIAALRTIQLDLGEELPT